MRITRWVVLAVLPACEFSLFGSTSNQFVPVIPSYCGQFKSSPCSSTEASVAGEQVDKAIRDYLPEIQKNLPHGKVTEHPHERI